MTAHSADRTEEEAPESQTVARTTSQSDGKVISPDRLQFAWTQQQVAEVQGLRTLARQAEEIRVPRREPHPPAGSVGLADRIFSLLTTGAGALVIAVLLLILGTLGWEGR